ncbi:MFS transporter [Patulibacter sp. SYSU D01012]|uniref:MFS transporter n=1 Tax=Patulibacter sp. SYSU D01012 TaxID=2817381 RepID=UPI001FEECE42|nr:MFS transporter [Patulibacter sp. SYSU D01012]
MRSSRRLLPSRLAYALVAAVLGMALAASATPSPLYAVYRAEWGFSSFVLTAIFAVYAIAVLVALLLTGRLSDDVGRRPVLIGALTAMIAATALFLVADSVAWLFAARALQGLSTGVAMSAAGAALLELHPRGDSHAAGLTNGVVAAASMGLGAFVSAALVEWAPAPERTPYAALLVVFAVLLVGALLMPETVAERRRPRLRPQRPHVPKAIRGAFALSSLGVLASWAIGGLFMSLGPQLAALELHTDSHLAGGLAILAMTGSGAVSQVLFERAAPWRLTAGGAIVLSLGMAGIVGSLSLDVGPVFLAASVLTGLGWGVAFLGALRSLTAVVPPHHRGETMSAFYLVAYTSISLPALGAGLVVGSWGLLPTFRVFGGLVVLAGLATAIGAVRMRPGGAPAPERAGALAALD